MVSRPRRGEPLIMAFLGSPTHDSWSCELLAISQLLTQGESLVQHYLSDAGFFKGGESQQMIEIPDTTQHAQSENEAALDK